MTKPMLSISLLLACAAVAHAQETPTKSDEPSHKTEKVEYARPELLVETDDLSRRLISSQVQTIILDARSREAYEKGHIPSAIWVDVAEWKKAFGEGEDKLGWSKRISKVGIGPDNPVVVYDEALTGSAARVWWVLSYWGVEEASILNGGMKAWEADGQPVDTDIPEIPANEFQAKPEGDRLVTHKELKKVLSDGDPFKLFDTRTAEEHEGGKIATCTHLDWQDLVDKETGKMLAAKELQQKFADAGYDPKQPAVTYCQSGGRASVMAFALELMGGQKVGNYYGSWGEWSEKELPPSDENAPESGEEN